MRVTRDDPRFDEWPSRKPSKKKITEARATALLGGNETLGKIASEAAVKITPRATRAVVNRAKAVGGVLASYAAAAGAKATATTAGAALAAGIGSYYLTRWLIDGFPTLEKRIEALQRQHFAARRDLAKALGRPLTPEEMQLTARRYRDAVAELSKPRTAQQRSGQF